MLHFTATLLQSQIIFLVYFYRKNRINHINVLSIDTYDVSFYFIFVAHLFATPLPFTNFPRLTSNRPGIHQMLVHHLDSTMSLGQLLRFLNNQETHPMV